MLVRVGLPADARHRVEKVMVGVTHGETCGDWSSVVVQGWLRALVPSSSRRMETTCTIYADLSVKEELEVVRERWYQSLYKVG